VIGNSPTPYQMPTTITGLPADLQDVYTGLVTRLREKATRNELRRQYYDGHNRLKDLGISIPPQLKTLEVVVGWPAKAVDSMSRRTILEGFTSTAGAEVADEIQQVWDGNRLAAEAPALHTSTLMQSCGFQFVTAGDVPAGEPKALVTNRAASWATGEWDARARSLRASLSVVRTEEATGRPTEINLYVPNLVVNARELRQGTWDLRYIPHRMGVPVELVPYKALLDRPYGRSRISRGVMYLTDAAVRTMLRTEVSAEFYNAPQRYVLGADEDAFKDDAGNRVPAWQVIAGRLNTLTRDEDGNLPQVGQFPQQSMQPNVEQLRSIAQMFAAETSLPVGALGIVQDNPSSAEAILAANEELGIEIEHWQRTALAPAWERTMRRALAITASSDAAVLAARTVRAQWGSWSAPSEASQAQAALARVQAVPRLAETDVELERMGYTRPQIERIQAQWAREASRSNLTGLIAAAGARTAPASQADPNAEASALKAKFDALGVAVRAGVDPHDAAARLGLTGIEFTGAVPVSLRLPEADAAQLEDA